MTQPECDICGGPCEGQWAHMFGWLDQQVKEHGREKVLEWMDIANKERAKKSCIAT